MQFSLDQVNWVYVGVSVALWLAFVIYLWRNPNKPYAQQWQQVQQNNPDIKSTYRDWINTPSVGGGAPVPTGRVIPIIGISFAFWFLLFVFVAKAASAA
jgi:hypothetical protein